MARPLQGNQKQFDFVESDIITGKSRNLVGPNIRCRLGIENPVALGKSADIIGSLLGRSVLWCCQLRSVR